MPTASVVRLPPRLRVVGGNERGALAARGFRDGKDSAYKELSSLADPKIAGGLALDVLLASGQIGDRQHAAGLAYRGLRRRYEAASQSTGRDAAPALGDAAWAALSRRHAALLWAAGHERFALDRLTLDDEAPMRCEVGRVGPLRLAPDRRLQRVESRPRAGRVSGGP